MTDPTTTLAIPKTVELRDPPPLRDSWVPFLETRPDLKARVDAARQAQRFMRFGS